MSTRGSIAWRFGYCHRKDMKPEQVAAVGEPQFHVGQTVTVLNPWWWKARDGRQIKDRLPCVVTEANGFWYPKGSGGDYSLTVRDANNPGAHSRSIREADIEGFVKPDYDTHPTGS